MPKALLKNHVSKSYLNDPQRFSQLYNNTLFGGRQVILPEKLRELDTTEGKTVGIDRKEAEGLWKERDLLKLYDDSMILAVLGIENQMDIHYAMPLRCLLYDTLNYEEQRRRIQKGHQENGDLQGAEYISGFARTDRLLPVFTLVVYYGSAPWDGPVNLHQMLRIPPQLAGFADQLADYRINLLDIHTMENLELYTGELKALLGFIRYQKEKDALRDFIHRNASLFCSISAESAQAISVLSDSHELEKYLEQNKLTDSQEGERSNMCEALQEMMADSRTVGKMEGRMEIIHTLVEDYLEEGISGEWILEKLQRRFRLTKEEALCCLEQAGKR